MKVTVTQTSSPLQYIAANDHAQIEVGANQYHKSAPTFRPMELILAGLASCSAIDIENILKKQKVQFQNLQIIVSGTRADAIPAVFERIELQVIVEGEVAENKLQRAIDLTKNKYCSVARMLSSSVEITYSYLIQKPQSK